LINKIIAVFFLFGAMDEKGWVLVEKPQQIEARQAVDESGAAWPVFSRQFGEDRVLVRFPEEPNYTYPRLEFGDSVTMHVESKMPYGTHRLLVSSLTSTLDAFMEEKKLSIASEEDALLIFSDQNSSHSADLLYRSNKMWVQERVFAFYGRIYVLQTHSESLNESPHLQFVDSFDLEIRDGNKVFHREIQSEN
jgi:hypothetical protein